MPVDEIHGGDWQSGLCDCAPCGSCVLGTFAPCILVGRTAARLRDPSDTSPEAFNGDCAIHGILTLFASGWIYSMIKRGDIRERFNIPGSGFGDCCAAFCCQCCQVMQADNEVKRRLMVSGPVNKGYEPQIQGMQMPPRY
ncbi:hypothetical protein G7054_g14189 [Neopestalotiopsis clavispora]|nr:hypothetical protein G7054_g14189 [Neopestalotiopsis clavispora]